MVETGVDTGQIRWVTVEGHRWHCWPARGGWDHYPYHCPPCQAALDPTGLLFLADALEHFDCDGHLQRWNGSVFEHRTMDCALCLNAALRRRVSQCAPGRAPTEQEKTDAALTRH